MGRPSKRNKVIGYIQNIREKHPQFTYQEIQEELKTVLIRRIKKDNPDFSEQRCIEELEIKDLMPSVSSIKNWLSLKNQQKAKLFEIRPFANRAWSYSSGSWKEIEDPINWQVWDDVSEVVEKNGYRLYSKLGEREDEDPNIEIYHKARNHFLVYASLNNSDLIQIYIEGIPDLMDWLSHYSIVFQLLRIDDKIDDLFTIGKKAFQSWHGHPYYNYCFNCDPDTYKHAEWAKNLRRKTEKNKPKETENK